jgi:Putative Ig domain
MLARAGSAVAVFALVALLAGATPPAPAARTPLPHVTLFGDSIASAIVEDDPARAILTNGLDMDFEVAPCRRIAQDSCPYNGVRPPTVLDVVKTLGAKLGPTVIVTLGYNEFEDQYAHNIDVALDAFKAAGVQKVLWLTLRAARHPYVTMNDALVAAAATHPSLIVVDWNLYSRSHPDWFQDDGIHLLDGGSKGMATLVRTTLAQLGIGAPAKKGKATPVTIATARLPDAKRNKPYAAKLAAKGGRAPYFWSLPRRLPAGLHLRSTGWVSGVPAGRPGTFAVTIRVRDARGSAATRRLSLRIRP